MYRIQSRVGPDLVFLARCRISGRIIQHALQDNPAFSFQIIRHSRISSWYRHTRVSHIHWIIIFWQFVFTTQERVAQNCSAKASWSCFEAMTALLGLNPWRSALNQRSIEPCKIMAKMLAHFPPMQCLYWGQDDIVLQEKNWGGIYILRYFRLNDNVSFTGVGVGLDGKRSLWGGEATNPSPFQILAPHPFICKWEPWPSFKNTL